MQGASRRCSQTLGENHDPIFSLYAAGNDSGGLFANNCPELLPGVACGRAITFGRLAGKKVAALQTAVGDFSLMKGDLRFG